MNNGDSITDSQHFIKLRRDVKDCSPRLAQREHLIDNESGRAGVQPPGRLNRYEDLRIAADLPSHHNFLLIATRKRSGWRVRPTGPHVKLRHARGRMRAKILAIEP